MRFLSVRSVKSESGAHISEYALLAAFLVGAFLLGGIIISQASKVRSDLSIDSISDMTPCQCIGGDCDNNRCY